MKVYGALRVSKGATNGASFEVQRATIQDAADREAWEVTWIEEVVTGTGKRARPELDAALDALDRGEADALVVSKIDRLSRSIIDFARMLKRSRANGWKIIALDMGVDFSTPQGKLLGSQLISFAEYEAEIIGARTRDALRVKRGEGIELGGANIPAVMVKRIRNLATRGHGLSEIARRLNDDPKGAPTARGGRWHASTVRAVLAR